MATPGFTAEAGLASTGRRYRTSRRASRATADSLVTPAASGFHYIGVNCYDGNLVATWVEWDQEAGIEWYHDVPVGTC